MGLPVFGLPIISRSSLGSSKVNKPMASTLDTTVLVITEAIAFDDNLLELCAGFTCKQPGPCILLLLHGLSEAARINVYSLEIVHANEWKRGNILA